MESLEVILNNLLVAENVQKVIRGLKAISKFIEGKNVTFVQCHIVLFFFHFATPAN